VQEAYGKQIEENHSEQYREFEEDNYMFFWRYFAQLSQNRKAYETAW